MPTAQTPVNQTDESIYDAVASLGWEGCVTLLALTLILVGSTDAGRRAAKKLAIALVRELRTLRVVRMGATRKLARRLQRDTWDKMCAHRGLQGLLRGRIARTTYGIAVHVRMSGSLTSEVVASKIKQIETGLGVAHDSIRLVPGRKADKAVVAITLRNPLDNAVAWPGHKCRDIAQPVALGRDETGKVIKVKVRQRFVVAGTSGAGKSVFLRIIGSAAVVSRNARLSYVDLKAVEASLWQRIDGVDVATTPDQVREMVNRIGSRMRTRLQEMAARGDVDHEPTVAEPAEIIIVDEGAELKRAGLDDVVHQLESLAQLGRAADFWLVWASQYPTDKSGGLPVGIGTQAEAVVGLRVETPRINRNVFGEDAGGTGWAADTLPGGGGWFMLRDAEHTKPLPCRAFFLDKGDIHGLTGVPVVKPQAPVEAVFPPRPTYDPTVHLNGPQIPAQTHVVPEVKKPERAKLEVKVTVADEIRMALGFSPEPIGNNEIARQIGRDRGAVSRAAAKLVAAGEVTANQDKKYSLVLTTADQADRTKGTEA
jgi:S-DNA-T family DNA segregation ATPase FtsK/SpoIIIE